MAATAHAALKTTPLNVAHRAAGGRMVAFAGYDMPVQYADGVLAEHRWTREHAGLFDVSHMGPAFLSLTDPSGDGQGDHEAMCALVEPLVCGDLRGLKPGQLRYTLLLNPAGGIIDDLMIGRPLAPERQGGLYVVVNAGTKDHDFALIATALGSSGRLHRADDRALLALQGPEAEAVLAKIVPQAADLGFMQFVRLDADGLDLVISRSGYTGEDGFEILVPAEGAAAFWDRLMADARVKPIGLGARDSLRLEAGLPLYGHDLDETTSPVEANLAFAINKRRREAADFPGAERILRELRDGPPRFRVGLKLSPGGPPAREGSTVIREFAPDAGPDVVEHGHHVGTITSGGPSPSLGHGIAMAYLPYDHRDGGTRLKVVVRGREQAAEVMSMPFFPHRYVRKPAPQTPGKA